MKNNSIFRWGAARNVNTPAAALEALAKDVDADVRWGAARNVNTPVAALEALDEENKQLT